MWAYVEDPSGKYVLKEEGRYVEVDGHYATIMVPGAEYAVQRYVGDSVEGGGEA